MRKELGGLKWFAIYSLRRAKNTLDTERTKKMSQALTSKNLHVLLPLIKSISWPPGAKGDMDDSISVKSSFAFLGIMFKFSLFKK